VSPGAKRCVKCALSATARRTVTSTFPRHEHERFVAHCRGLLGAWAGDQRAAAGETARVPA